jgi:hypothetical protein
MGQMTLRVNSPRSVYFGHQEHSPEMENKQEAERGYLMESMDMQGFTQSPSQSGISPKKESGYLSLLLGILPPFTLILFLLNTDLFFLTFLFFCLAPIPTVMCGHLGRRKGLKQRESALFGLILGYSAIGFLLLIIGYIFFVMMMLSNMSR